MKYQTPPFIAVLRGAPKKYLVTVAAGERAREGGRPERHFAGAAFKGRKFGI